MSGEPEPTFVTLPGVEVTVYSVTAAPPLLDGGSKLTVA